MSRASKANCSPIKPPIPARIMMAKRNRRAEIAIPKLGAVKEEIAVKATIITTAGEKDRHEWPHPQNEGADDTDSRTYSLGEAQPCFS